MELEIKNNNGQCDIYCNYCKNVIREGEKYGIVFEEESDGSKIEKPHHLECLPETEEEDLYIPTDDEE